MAAFGTYRHRALLEGPGPQVPDPDGGFTASWVPLTPPDWECAILPATTRDLESLGAGSTVIAQATHIVRGRFHPGLTTQCRLTVTDPADRAHLMNVIMVTDPEIRGLETVLICAEVVA